MDELNRKGWNLVSIVRLYDDGSRWSVMIDKPGHGWLNACGRDFEECVATLRKRV